MNKHLIAIATIAIAVTGCAAPQAPAPAATEDLNVGIAKSCTPSTVDLTTANAATGTIKMTNDGWCALHVKQASGQPYQLGLVTANPAHGRILIQKIGGETRIEYTAADRYVGADRFTVALRPTTANTPDATVQVAVDVTMGENMAPAPAPAASSSSTTHSTAAPARTRRPTTH